MIAENWKTETEGSSNVGISSKEAARHTLLLYLLSILICVLTIWHWGEISTWP